MFKVHLSSTIQMTSLQPFTTYPFSGNSFLSTFAALYALMSVCPSVNNKFKRLDRELIFGFGPTIHNLANAILSSSRTLELFCHVAFAIAKNGIAANILRTNHSRF